MAGLFKIMSDRVSIYDKADHLVAENQRALVNSSNGTILCDGECIIEVDYLIKRKISNGLIEQYRVVESHYQSAVRNMPAHYKLKVENIKKMKTPDYSSNSIVNHFHVSDNGRVYQDSIDISKNNYNSYSWDQLKGILNNVKNEVGELDLHQAEFENINRNLQKIEDELQKENPDKGILRICIELLPISVTALQSVVTLGQMLGIS